MPIMSISLPDDLAARLQDLCRQTGRSLNDLVAEALEENLENLEDLDDLEDLHLAEQRIRDQRAGRSRTCSSEEVEAIIDALYDAMEDAMEDGTDDGTVPGR